MMNNELKIKKFEELIGIHISDRRFKKMLCTGWRKLVWKTFKTVIDSLDTSVWQICGIVARNM